MSILCGVLATSFPILLVCGLVDPPVSSVGVGPRPCGGGDLSRQLRLRSLGIVLGTTGEAWGDLSVGALVMSAFATRLPASRAGPRVDAWFILMPSQGGYASLLTAVGPQNVRRAFPRDSGSISRCAHPRMRCAVDAGTL